MVMCMVPKIGPLDLLLTSGGPFYFWGWFQPELRWFQTFHSCALRFCRTKIWFIAINQVWSKGVLAKTEIFSNFTVQPLKQPISARRSKSPFEFYDTWPHFFFQKFFRCGQEWSIFSNIYHFERGVMLRFGLRSINAILVNWHLWR